MHKNFNVACRGGLGSLAYLFKRKLTRQYYLREAGSRQHRHLFGRAGVGLGAGVKVDWWQVELKQSHVLHNQRVHAGGIQIFNRAFDFIEFVLIYDGVEGNVNPYSEFMGFFDNAGNIGNGIPGGGTGTESRSADIYGVCAVGDCSHGRLCVTGRSKQFKLWNFLSHCAVISKWTELRTVRRLPWSRNGRRC